MTHSQATFLCLSFKRKECKTMILYPMVRACVCVCVCMSEKCSILFVYWSIFLFIGLLNATLFLSRTLGTQRLSPLTLIVLS